MNPFVLYAKKIKFVALRKTGRKVVKVDSIFSKVHKFIKKRLHLVRVLKYC